jgi:hypothetical protein
MAWNNATLLIKYLLFQLLFSFCRYVLASKTSRVLSIFFSAEWSCSRRLSGPGHLLSPNLPTLQLVYNVKFTICISHVFTALSYLVLLFALLSKLIGKPFILVYEKINQMQNNLETINKIKIRQLVVLCSMVVRLS